MPELIYLDLGRVAYLPTLQLQRRLVKELQGTGDGRAYLLLLEHDPPVITLGRRGQNDHILSSGAELLAGGIEVHRTRRGGLVTVHAPGQLVGYPILSLRSGRLKLGEYVHKLEEVLVRLLGRFGLEGRREEGQIGLWVGREKVAAIGVAVSRWVTYHGFALNVSTDLSHFERIVPCGTSEAGVTNLAKLTGGVIGVSQTKPSLVECFAEVFGFQLQEIRHEHSPENL